MKINNIFTRFLARLIYFILVSPLVILVAILSVLEGFIWIFYPPINIDYSFECFRKYFKKIREAGDPSRVYEGI